MCRELESENANLQEEYQHLKASSNNSSVSGGSTTTGSGATGSSNIHQQQQLTTKPFNASGVPSDAEILQEAKMLREHKGRLETRMKILEDHNSQLESQLGKLKMMLHDVSVKEIHNNGMTDYFSGRLSLWL